MGGQTVSLSQFPYFVPCTPKFLYHSAVLLALCLLFLRKEKNSYWAHYWKTTHTNSVQHSQKVKPIPVQMLNSTSAIKVTKLTGNWHTRFTAKGQQGDQPGKPQDGRKNGACRQGLGCHQIQTTDRQEVIHGRMNGLTCAHLSKNKNHLIH